MEGDPRLRILSEDGVEFDAVSSSEASTLGEYWNGVRHYLRTGDDSRLWGLEGEQVAGRTLLTDLDLIDHWARTGELDFEDIYEG